MSEGLCVCARHDSDLPRKMPHIYHEQAFHRTNIKLHPYSSVVYRLPRVENMFAPPSLAINPANIGVPILRKHLLQNGQKRQVIK